jgi:hypothetical protein
MIIQKEKTNMRKFRHVYIEIYMVNVYFIMCDFKTYERKILLEFGNAPENSNNAVGKFEVYRKGNTPIGVIWMTKWEALAHEIFHCVHWIMQCRGLRLDDSSEEAYAYLTQYLDSKLRN